MIGKNTIKRISSLHQKKYRREQGIFIAEGERLVEEIIRSGLITETIYYTQDWKQKEFTNSNIFVEISSLEMKKISGLTTPSPVLAIVGIPNYTVNIHQLSGSLTLALDDVQDPGNMGTIIRLADWFGIEHIVCSTGTVDVFSPKVVQATMGAIARVKIIYMDLPDFLSQISSLGVEVFGTFTNGENIFREVLSGKGVVVMGNEGNGICEDVEKWITKRLTIPNYSTGAETSESLNVAMATAIVCAEFRRRT